MKAKELMICDWIHVNAISNYSKVGYLTRMHDKSIFIEGDGWGAFEEGIEPIPLTEEILIENGICYQFGQPWFQGYKPLTTKGVFEIVYKNIVRLPVRYVHELQHALRLCGLNELADNFKVE